MHTVGCSSLLALPLPPGWGLSIHVDAASGGFVAPFVYPDLKWCVSLRQHAVVG